MAPSAPGTAAALSSIAPKPTPIAIPYYRPLKAYAFDPSQGRYFGNYMALNVKYERLTPGPVGEQIAVIDYDASNDCYYEPVNLDEDAILINNGLDPSESDPRFHQQMVYAVIKETIERFEFALGRKIHWRRESGREGVPYRGKLRIFPHCMQEANAYYDPSIHAILFGYFAAPPEDELNLPGQTIFSCLSHDIVAHETTHALVDSIRPYFMDNTSVDTPAFHEAFADMIALLQHFSMHDVMREAIAGTHGLMQMAELAPLTGQGAEGKRRIGADLARNNPLVNLATQFGSAMEMRAGLRSAIGTPPNSRELETKTEPHDRGSILVAAVFDAYFTAYIRRTRDLMAMAQASFQSTSELHPDLVNRLANEASKAAKSFEHICIRALDYCPVTDIQFGDFLQALITADSDLVSTDRYDYRGCLIDAFRSRGIQPNARSYSEEALRWSAPIGRDGSNVKCEGLDVRLQQNMTDEQRRSTGEQNARIIYKFAVEHAVELGLDPVGENSKLNVFSFHPVLRTAPDGQPVLELVAQILQTRIVAGKNGAPDLTVHGGAALVFGMDGTVRYAIHKSAQRIAESQQEFQAQLQGCSALAPYREISTAQINFRALHRGY
jgi:hypothetical protein